MKSFKIPMLSIYGAATRGLAMSLLGLCLLSGLDAPPARADFTFGPRVNLGPPVNSPQNDSFPVISRDGLELYFGSDNRPDGYGGWDIWMSKRASVDDPWGPPVNLGPGINSAGYEGPESISSDGLTLYGTVSPAGTSDCDMFMATRLTIDAPWGPFTNMSPLLNSAFDSRPIISPDDLELYFYSIRSGGLGGADIYVSTRATRNDPWGPPVNLGPTINTGANDAPVIFSPDGLILFIGSDRPGGFGGYDTWMIWRPSKGAAWSAPVNLGSSFNTPNDDCLYSVSGDGQWAYIGEIHRGPTNDMWITPILPIVDFNGDGTVDIADVFIMLEHWHTDYSLCDIGPMPWGDGIVDAQDLIVLAEHMANNPVDVNDVNEVQ
jgi:hypothetical protein